MVTLVYKPRIFKSVLPALEPVFEPSPFPIGIQTAADLEAARFDLLTNWPLARLPEVCGLGSVTVMASSSQANICSPLK